jgi:hypothetical protein
MVRWVVLILAVMVVAVFVVMFIDNVRLRFGYEERLAEAIRDALPELDRQYESSLATLFRALDGAEAELERLGLAQDRLDSVTFQLGKLRDELNSLVEDRVIPVDAGEIFEGALSSGGGG